jgi:hypothetical protein
LEQGRGENGRKYRWKEGKGEREVEGQTNRNNERIR